MGNRIQLLKASSMGRNPALNNQQNKLDDFIKPIIFFLSINLMFYLQCEPLYRKAVYTMVNGQKVKGQNFIILTTDVSVSPVSPN